MEERQPHGKALLLLAHACSMRFLPDSINEPFRPFLSMDGCRPIISDEFPEADISFFSQIVDEIDDPWLKARLADLVWSHNTLVNPISPWWPSTATG